jgi:hypothetical protein
MKHSNTVVQLKEAWFSSIIICHQVCNKSNTTRVTCVAEPVYPSGAPEFTTGLFTLLEHQSSPPVCLPFWNTRVHPRSVYLSGTPEFTPGLLTLLEHQSSPPVYLPFWNTRVHPRSVYPSGTPEFTPCFHWVSHWSIFSFLCNVLWIIVCPFPFGNVLSVLFTTSHDLWQTFLGNGSRLP